jgi:hypothetical protein
MDERLAFRTLEEYLAKVPEIVLPFGHGFGSDGCWIKPINYLREML